MLSFGVLLVVVNVTALGSEPVIFDWSARARNPFSECTPAAMPVSCTGLVSGA